MFPGKQVCRCFFSHSCTRQSLKTITAFPPEKLCSYRRGAPRETTVTPVYLWARLCIEKTVFFSISCTPVDILKTYIQAYLFFTDAVPVLRQVCLHVGWKMSCDVVPDIFCLVSVFTVPCLLFVFSFFTGLFSYVLFLVLLQILFFLLPLGSAL